MLNVFFMKAGAYYMDSILYELTKMNIDYKCITINIG